MAIKLLVELDDNGTPKIDRLTDAMENLGQETTKSTRKMRSDFKKTSDVIGKLGSKIRRMASSLPAMLGAAGAAGAMGLMVKKGISLNATLESTETRFRVIYGNADKAAKKMKELESFSASTPFQLDKIANASAMLVAFGLDGTRNLRMVGDAAAAAQRPIEEMAMIFGRIKGGAFGEAFMRLAETGLATREALEMEGLQFDKGGSYVGSADDAMKAVQSIIERRFGGMMVKMSEDWTGAMSTMKDNWGLLVKDLTKPLFEKIKPHITAIIKKLQEMRNTEAIEKLAQDVADFAGFMITAAGKTADAVKQVWYFKEAIGAATIALTAYAVVIQTVTHWTQMAEIATSVWSAAIKANPIGLLVATLVLLVAWLAHVEAKTGKLSIQWAMMMAMIKGTIGGIKAHLKGWHQTIALVSQATFQFGGVSKKIWTAMGTVVRDALRVIWNISKRTFTDITEILQQVGLGMKAAFTLDFDAVDSAMQRIGEITSNGFSDSLEELKGIGASAFTGIGEDILAITSATAVGYGIIWQEASEGAARSMADAYLEALKKIKATQDKFKPDAPGAPAGDGSAPDAKGQDQPTGAGAGRGMAAYYDQQLARVMAYGAARQEYERGLANELEELWGGYYGSISDMTAMNLSDGLARWVNEGSALKDVWKDMWRDMKTQFVQMTADMAVAWAQRHVMMAVAKIRFEKTATGAALSGAKTRTAASLSEAGAATAEAAADTHSAAAKTHKAHAGIPFVGAMIAAAMVGFMIASISRAKKKRTGGSVDGFGSGSVDNQPHDLARGEYVSDASTVSRVGGPKFFEGLKYGVTPQAGGSNVVQLNINGDSGNDDFARDVEERIVPILETMMRQRRFSVKGAA